MPQHHYIVTDIKFQLLKCSYDLLNYLFQIFYKALSALFLRMVYFEM
jgi:hypothetical protein